MPGNPEALAQIARLLGDDRLRVASPIELQAAVEAGFDRLVDGLVAEASASDDVTDRDTALAYLDDRLSFLEPLLGAELRTRISAALRAKIEAW